MNSLIGPSFVERPIIDEKPKHQLAANEKIQLICGNVADFQKGGIFMYFGWIPGNSVDFGQKQLNTVGFHLHQSALWGIGELSHSPQIPKFIHNPRILVKQLGMVIL